MGAGDLASRIALGRAIAAVRAAARPAAAFEALAGDPVLGQVWALGGSALPTSPDTIFVRPTDAPDDPAIVARNPSRKEWAMGDLVQCEWMSAGPGPVLPTVVHHERIVPQTPTAWTATFAYTNEIVANPPTTEGGSVSVSVDGDDGLPHGPFTWLTISARGRNAAGRQRTGRLHFTLTTTYVDQSGTEGGNPLVTAFGGPGMFNVNPNPPRTVQTFAEQPVAVDSDWVGTYSYQHHGTASWIGPYALELYEPEAHYGVEPDDDYIVSAATGDAIYG